MERTPIRASIHQQAPRPAAASTALTSGCHCVTTSGPKTATRGMSAIAGNGAKGTKTRSPTTITSYGPERTLQPQASMEERVRQVEEVGPPGVELVRREPVDGGRHHEQPDKGDGAAVAADGLDHGGDKATAGGALTACSVL